MQQASDWDLWSVNQANFATLQELLGQLRREGVEAARAEAAYYAAKSSRALELQEDGMAATMVSLVIKGDPHVNRLLERKLETSANHKATMQAIFVIQSQIKVNDAQLAREYAAQGYGA